MQFSNRHCELNGFEKKNIRQIPNAKQYPVISSFPGSLQIFNLEILVGLTTPKSIAVFTHFMTRRE